MDTYYLTVTIVTLIVILLVLPVIFKIILKITAGWDNSPTSLVGKTVIVTGANIGIGYYTARDFAKRGGRVILACRDRIKAEDAKKRIIESTGNTNIIVRIVDFASLSSVRQFAMEIKETEERLDILVNNAGAAGLPHSITPDGLNLIMQINYFGPFLLTILLLGLLKKSAPSRIVNVASLVSHFASLNLEDLNAYPRAVFGKSMQYSNSKLCNIIFSNELARRLKDTGVTVNSLHPGTIQTELFRNTSGPGRFLCFSLAKLFYKTVEEGAQTSIYVAVSPELNGISGKYFSDCSEAWIMPLGARSKETARILWDKSEEFVKLNEVDKLSLINSVNFNSVQIK